MKFRTIALSTIIMFASTKVFAGSFRIAPAATQEAIINQTEIPLIYLFESDGNGGGLESGTWNVSKRYRLLSTPTVSLKIGKTICNLAMKGLCTLFSPIAKETMEKKIRSIGSSIVQQTIDVMITTVAQTNEPSVSIELSDDEFKLFQEYFLQKED